MGVARHLTRPDEDDGFSLVETIVAMVVLGSILLVTITVISSAFSTLGGAKETDVANNIGQARIEAARSLDFADVGTVSGSPDGTLVSSETVEVQGVDLQIDTTVQWVGSATGLDLLDDAQTGDGVPGFFDPGIDYKLVTITVTPNGDGDPIVFETIIAPPNVAAAEGAANLLVSIAKDEPSFASSDTSLPRVYLHPASGLIAGDLNLEQVPFLDIEDGVDHPIRLGPALTDTSDGTWAMSDTTLSTSIGAATTSTEVLTIYRPITLEVTATDDVGTLLADATLVVTDQDTSDTLTLTQADMSSPGVWTVTELVAGVPLKHGNYSYVVSAPDHVTSVDVDVSAPQSYPLDVTERTTVALEPVVTTTDVTFTVTDEPKNGSTSPIALAGVEVAVTPAVSSPYTVFTDINGQVVLTLDNDELHDFVVTSPYGHQPDTLTGVEGDGFAGDVYTFNLDTGTDAALFRLISPSGALFDGVFQYQPTSSSGDDWLEAEPNALGEVSIVATEHAHANNRWEARILCDDTTTSNVRARNYKNFNSDKTRDDFDHSC
ncbi:MAG: type II secretion system protein [Actinomycetota bacterium]